MVLRPFGTTCDLSLPQVAGFKTVEIPLFPTYLLFLWIYFHPWDKVLIYFFKKEEKVTPSTSSRKMSRKERKFWRGQIFISHGFVHFCILDTRSSQSRNSTKSNNIPRILRIRFFNEISVILSKLPWNDWLGVVMRVFCLPWGRHSCSLLPRQWLVLVVCRIFSKESLLFDFWKWFEKKR